MDSSFDSPPVRPAQSGIRLRLSIMMLFQFFIWGAWYELGFDYIPKLGFNNDWQLPLVFGAFNIGALVALFFSTQFADRKFAAEKFMAFSHLVGGVAILGLFFLPGQLGTEQGQYLSGLTVTRDPATGKGVGTVNNTNVVVEGIASEEWPKVMKPGEEPKLTITALVQKVAGGSIYAFKQPIAPFWPFFLLMLIHSVFYVPTISIANSIAFANLSDPTRQFGPVRLWGTIGWIAASWPFIFILVDWAKVPAMNTMPFGDWLGTALGTSLEGSAAMAAKSYIWLVAGAASLLMAAISLGLPHTPPKPATGEDSLAWLKAMKLLRQPFVFVLFLVTFIDAAVHQSFFFWTFTFLGPTTDGGVVNIPSNWVGPVMKIGQIAEIVTMLFLGFVLKSLGWRWTLTIGVLGHAARFAVFSHFPDPLPAILVNAIHGICYAFFFATVYIFVDEYFPKDVRSSAQGLFNVLILGIGPFAANFACGQLKEQYTVGGNLNYTAVFQYSMGAAVLAAVLLVVLFHPPKKDVVKPSFSKVEEDAPPVA